MTCNEDHPPARVQNREWQMRRNIPFDLFGYFYPFILITPTNGYYGYRIPLSSWRAAGLVMEAGGTLLNGKFKFKIGKDGSVDKTKVICTYCQCELSYHRSSSSLKYHLMAKHSTDVDSPPPPQNQTQTRWDSFCFRQRPMDLASVAFMPIY